MRIDSTELTVQATHLLTAKHSIVERRLQRSSSPMIADTVTLSVGNEASVSEVGSGSIEGVDAKHQVAILVLETIFGCRFKWTRSCAARTRASASSLSAPVADSVEITHRSEFISESERTSFQVAGSVSVADGRTIDFRVSLDMRRVYQAQRSSLFAVQATDPLIVNLRGGPARLTEAEIEFDLDSDGVEDRIHFVADGSAFLVIDRNDDGLVNDGSELFGPRTGDGFAELAVYDADGNHWIDQGDFIYDQLRVWSRSGLQTLAQVGIGAISLVSVETPFSITGSNNELWGQIRTTAPFVFEDGSPGTVQQVDLA